jgi:hypothetical protein
LAPHIHTLALRAVPLHPVEGDLKPSPQGGEGWEGRQRGAPPAATAPAGTIPRNRKEWGAVRAPPARARTAATPPGSAGVDNRMSKIYIISDTLIQPERNAKIARWPHMP